MLVPKSIYKDDREFFIETTRDLTIWDLRAAIDGYDKVYQDCIKERGDTLRGNQYARTTANTRLRNYVDRVLKANGSR